MKPIEIIIHHEGASNGFAAVNEWHKIAKDQFGNFRYHSGSPSSLGYWCGYHYYIPKTGKTIQARKDDESGAHTIGHNQTAIGICLEGNFDDEQPTVNQRHESRELINRKMREWSIQSNKIGGHRQFKNTSCPGKNLSESELKQMFIPDIVYYQKILLSIQQMLIDLKLKYKLGSVVDQHGR